MKLGLACIDCHTGADIRAAAGIPSVRTCMFCHAKLARKKPEVQKVIGYAEMFLRCWYWCSDPEKSMEID